MKNIIRLAGLAMAAVVATGCAGGPESLAMENDNALTQVVGEGLVTLSADRELPVTGAARSITEAAAVDDAAAAVAASPSCPVAPPSAVTMASALPMAGCVRGSLLASDAGRHFILRPMAGGSYRIAVTHAVDARFDLGQVTTAQGAAACVPFATNLTATRLTVEGNPGALCVVVRSDSGEAQPFRLIAE